MKLGMNHATLMNTQIPLFMWAVSKAGFEGVELRRDQVFEYLKYQSINDLKNLFIDQELECLTFNAIELFSLCPEAEFKKILSYTKELMEIGTKIGCDKIIAVPSFLETPLSEEEIIAQTVERLGVLTNLAEEYNFKLGFEPLGFKNCSVRKLDLALRIIENENLPEIGLVIDTFHYFLGEHNPGELKEIDGRKIWLIHVNDSIEKPLDQLQDSDRVFPGEGIFQLKEFIDNLKSIKYDGWLSLELFNETVWERDPFVVANESMSALKKII